MRPMPELEITTVNVADLMPYAGNAKLHPHEQVDQIAASIEQFGNCDPIGVWHNDAGEMEIVEGHGRVMALNKLGIETAPVIFLDHLTDEQRRAYALVHNQLTMNSDFDTDLLELELDAITDIDMSDFGFDLEVEDMSGYDYTDGEKGSLSERWVVPPFSVLNTRLGDWQERKQQWLEITGSLSETRDGEYGTFGGGLTKAINGGTSNFDPVLAETMYAWFCPKGGKVLDPFGGEQTKGVVAGECGYRYTAVEIRPEQVALNEEKTSRYDGVRYVCGDSNQIEQLVGEHDFDMCLTSPPYYDLEVYSAADMSALGTYEEFIAQYANILQQCYRMLNDNSFMVIKVAEIRDKKTGEYRSFVADTINVLRQAGFKYYNEIILVNAVGTAAMRANGNMKTRKVCKVHQNVLVFYKGDLKQIPKRLEQLDFSDLADDANESV